MEYRTPASHLGIFKEWLKVSLGRTKWAKHDATVPSVTRIRNLFLFNRATDMSGLFHHQYAVWVATPVACR